MNITHFSRTFLVILLLTMTFNLNAQTDLPESLGRCLGVYKTNYPEIFKIAPNFQYLKLEKFPEQDTDDPSRGIDNKVYIKGEVQVNGNQTFVFESASIKIVTIKGEEFYRDIEFQTIKIKNIKYKFSGRFLERIVLQNNQYSKISGTLIKYKNGKRINSSEVSFYEFGEL